MTIRHAVQRRRHPWMRGALSRAAYVAVSLFALACASVPRNEVGSGTGASGTWILNELLSQSLADESGAMREYTRSTDRIVLFESRSSLTLTFVDERQIEVATVRGSCSTSDASGITAWWDETLRVEHAIGGVMIMERYIHLPASNRLVVAVHVPGGPAERLRVYDRR